MVGNQGSIFICYRRGPTNTLVAKFFFKYLGDYFGEEGIFKDLETLEPGEDFMDKVKNVLASCDVMLVIIGRDWLIKDSKGVPRIMNSRDWVRFEVRSALQRNIKVMPILIDGATMPHTSKLPEDLQSLPRRHFIEVRTDDIETGASKIIKAIDPRGKYRKVEPPPPFNFKEQKRAAEHEGEPNYSLHGRGAHQYRSYDDDRSETPKKDFGTLRGFLFILVFVIGFIFFQMCDDYFNWGIF